MPNGIIQLPMLGDPGYGRFGNQLFTVAYANAYAQSIGAVLELPAEWSGRIIFPHFKDYPTISTGLPCPGFHYMPNGETNLALLGFYQNQTALNLWKNMPYKTWFKFNPLFENICYEFYNWDKIVNPQNLEHPTVLYHRRAGDYIETPYPIIELNHILNIMRDHMVGTRRYKFSGCGDCPDNQKLPQFFRNTKIDFISDFIFMTMADVLIRSNSSFSWWAAALGKPGQTVLAPLVQGETSKEATPPFVEGNYPAFVPHDAHHTDLHL